MSEQRPTSADSPRPPPAFTSRSEADWRRGDRRTGHGVNNHFALLYETRTQQFATAIPFVREGLDRNERCLYVADDNAEEAVVEAMRESGVDVDAARESGQLLIYTAEDTYLRTGEFDRDAMLDFWESSLAEAHDRDYAGVRATAEMTWALDSDANLDVIAAYEDALNALYAGEDYAVLCQYDRDRFPSEFLSDVVDRHPKLAYDDAVADNVYYVPPGEDVDEASASQKLDWQLRTVVERTRAQERLERRERGLNALNEASRELMSADADAIADRAPEIARSVLDVAFTSFWPHNENTGELELHSSSTSLQTDVTALADLYEERAWQTFVTERTDAHNDLQPDPDLADSEIPLRSGVIVPVGRHGVFCAGSTRPNAFDSATIDLAKAVGATVETALDRADRERELAEANSRLEELDRINRTIRGIDEALVEADTREEVEETVCELLASSSSYQFAWIGERDAGADELIAREWAGIEEECLDDITADDAQTDRGPVGTAIRTRTVQVVQDILTDAAFKPWREKVLDYGVRSAICVPIVYEESLYGALCVYADGPNAFDDRERDVLAELGETIAHTIDAIETKRALRTDRVVELEMRVRDANTGLCELARRADCRIELEGHVAPDETQHLFFTSRGASAEAVRTAGERIPDVAGLDLVTQHGEECQFEALVDGSGLGTLFADENALVRSLTTTGTEVSVVVDLPSTTDVREFVETVRETWPRTELVTRHTRERSIKTHREFRTAFEARLTDRQREVLQTAYLSGFFESPRARTGNELAESLGISQPTFTQHLRAAQRKLFEMVFDTV